jgi:hypothetical protein
MVHARNALVVAALTAATAPLSAHAVAPGSVEITARIGDETGVAIDTAGGYAGNAGTARAGVTVERRGRQLVVTVVPQ